MPELWEKKKGHNMSKKKSEKEKRSEVIGTIGGCEITLNGKTLENITVAKKLLGTNEYIYFYGFEAEGGHHPSFFEAYPQLTKFRSNQAKYD